MKGLEISRRFFEEYGRQMLEENFPSILPLIAVGLVGSGSECLGYDDEVSRDHDFEPGFCIFIPGEDIVDRQTAFKIERAYAKLPKEYEGLKRSVISPVGGSRHGVIRIDEFYEEKVGSASGALSAREWLTIPEHALLEATSGEVFFDNYGLFSDIRSRLSAMPEDIRLKKLAGALIIMAQSGQYNYNRCLAHGETGAAQLAAIEFARSAMHAVFLLNGKYMPYYKWSFRAMRDLPILSQLADTVEFLLSGDNDASNAAVKSDIIEDVAQMIISNLMEQKITEAICGDLEKHAYSVNDRISDPNLRNMSVFAGV